MHRKGRRVFIFVCLARKSRYTFDIKQEIFDKPLLHHFHDHLNVYIKHLRAYQKSGTQDPMRTQDTVRTKDPRRTQDPERNQEPGPYEDPGLY